MEIKPGRKTTEFWVTALANMANATILLLIVYGVLNSETSAAWHN